MHLDEPDFVAEIQKHTLASFKHMALNLEFDYVDLDYLGQDNMKYHSCTLVCEITVCALILCN